MKLGVNTVDAFSGDHLALNVATHLNEFSLVEMVKQLHQELGVDIIELPANLMVICPDLFNRNTMAKLGEYQADSKVGYTVHLPFRGLDVSSLCRPIAETSIRVYKEIIQQLEESLQVEHYVMHLTEMMLKQISAKRYLEEEIKEQVISRMYSQAKEGVREILDAAPKGKLLLENIKSGWLEPFSIAKELKAGICCDIGHLLLENADVKTVIKEYRSLIREFHFHDAVEWTLEDGTSILQDHVALGTGILDVAETLDCMLAENFEGIVMIEVGRFEAARKSVKVIREYLKNR